MRVAVVFVGVDVVCFIDKLEVVRVAVVFVGVDVCCFVDILGVVISIGIVFVGV